jgi:hypothetical protein
MGRLLAALFSAGDFRFILPCNMQYSQGERSMYAARRLVSIENVTLK